MTDEKKIKLQNVLSLIFLVLIEIITAVPTIVVYNKNLSSYILMFLFMSAIFSIATILMVFFGDKMFIWSIRYRSLGLKYSTSENENKLDLSTFGYVGNVVGFIFIEIIIVIMNLIVPLACYDIFI